MHVATPIHGPCGPIGRPDVVIGCGVITPVSYIHVFPRSFSPLLVGSFDSGLLGKSKCDGFCHLSHLLVAVIETAQKTTIFYSTFDALVILVDEVEATYLLFLTSQSA